MDNGSTGIKILLIEDNPGDVRLVRELLAESAETRFTLECADRLSTGLTRLAEGDVDVLLLDLALPDSVGFDTFAKAYIQAPRVPIIILTALDDHAIAVKAVREGAQDYLHKGRMDGHQLEHAVRYAIERKRFERILRETTNTLEAVIDASPIAICILDRADNVKLWNPAAERLFGWRRQELLGRPCPIIPPDRREDYRAFREQVLHGQTCAAIETVREKKDGTSIDVSLSMAPLQDAGGGIWGSMRILEDITERKRAEATRHALCQAGVSIQEPLALQETLDRILQAARDVLSFGRVNILLADSTGQWLEAVANLGTEEPVTAIRVPIGPEGGWVVEAYRTQKMIVWDGHDPVPASLRLQPPYDQIEAFRSQIFVNLPLVVQGCSIGVMAADWGPSKEKIGPAMLEVLQLFAAHAALAIEHGRLYEAQRMAAIQLEATVEERTQELQTANARLQVESRRAEEASRHKSAFLANMSHELRTPLNSILGFSELLETGIDGPLTEKQARFLHHISDSGKHLLQLINDMLDLSKVEAGRLDLRPETFALPDALTAAIELLRVQAEAKGLELSLQLQEAPSNLTADPLRINQIFYNLLSNAVKFTPAGGSVTVGARQVRGAELEAGEFVEIAVQDNGIGIKAEDLGRLFQEFTQLASSIAKPFQGTGLGLALTKRLVELHGGTLTATSPGEGRGSTFTVTLPLSPP